jgi:hypothetical protein
LEGLLNRVFFRWPDSAIAMNVRVFGPAALWLMFLAAAIFRYGKRGLWLLVGAPFALFAPVAWCMYLFACFRGAPC